MVEVQIGPNKCTGIIIHEKENNERHKDELKIAARRKCTNSFWRSFI